MQANTAPPRSDDHRAAASRRRKRARPTLEQCEGRTLLTTYTVTALTDTGAGHGTTGDLRYCIQQADNDGQRDTINFAVAGTIPLRSPLPSIVSGRGVTLAGPGPGAVTIQGGGPASSFTILRVKQGATAAISGLTFADGNTDDIGGALINGGRLTITDTTFAGNLARRNGGAILNAAGGDLTITDSTFLNNAADAGGAIYSFGRVTMVDSTLIGNTAGSSGGGIEGTFGTLKITNTTFAGNSAKIFGGGISLNGPRDFVIRGGSLTLINSTLENNRAGATDDTGFGGGLASNDNQVTISGSTFTGNTSGRDAGGVGINGGPISIAATNFLGNATSGRGGGILINGGRSLFGFNVTNGASLILTNSAFLGNQASQNGGGIEVIAATVRGKATTLTANSAGVLGGGIALYPDPVYNVTRSRLRLTNSTITANSAGANGGGISNFDQVTLTNVTITGNLATQTGGGIYNRGILAANHSTINQNRPNNVAGTT